LYPPMGDGSNKSVEFLFYTERKDIDQVSLNVIWKNLRDELNNMLPLYSTDFYFSLCDKHTLHRILYYNKFSI
jgi:hypothetical protein